MSKHGWTIWIIPVALWGLYSCWHCGYQSGYHEGHEAAWKMYQPFMPTNHVATNHLATVPEIEEIADSDITR